MVDAKDSVCQFPAESRYHLVFEIAKVLTRKKTPSGMLTIEYQTIFKNFLKYCKWKVS